MKSPCHPTKGATLLEWFGSSYDTFALVLPPFSAEPSEVFTEQARKDATSVRWSYLCERLNCSVSELATSLLHHVHELPAGHVAPRPDVEAFIASRGLAPPPPGMIASSLEATIGSVLLGHGERSIDVFDEFGIDRASVDVSDLLRARSAFAGMTFLVSHLRSSSLDLLATTQHDRHHVLVAGDAAVIQSFLMHPGLDCIPLPGGYVVERWWLDTALAFASTPSPQGAPVRDEGFE